MAAQTDIPLRFPEDPKAQRRELERMAASLTSYFAGITGHPHAGVVARRYTKRPQNDTKAAFWQMTPVALPGATDVHTVSLPPPDVRNAGLETIVIRQTTTGTIHLSGSGALVNGLPTATLVNDLGYYAVLFDGANYYTPPGSTNVGWEP